MVSLSILDATTLNYFKNMEIGKGHLLGRLCVSYNGENWRFENGASLFSLLALLGILDVIERGIESLRIFEVSGNVFTDD